MDSKLNRHTDQKVDGQQDEQTDRWTGGGLTDRGTKRYINSKLNRQIDQKVDGL